MSLPIMAPLSNSSVSCQKSLSLYKKYIVIIIVIITLYYYNFTNIILVSRLMTLLRCYGIIINISFSLFIIISWSEKM